MVHGDTLEDNQGHGSIVVWWSNPQIRDCVIRGNDVGIHSGSHVPSRARGRGASPSAPERLSRITPDSIIVENCTLDSNRVGFRHMDDPAGVRLTGCRITGNRDYGVQNLTSSSVVDARLNWWGHPTGPGGAGPGQGDRVTERVLYDPWLTGGQPIASTDRIGATASNNARKMVRSEAPPFYKLFYTDAQGVWVTMTNNPLTGPWTVPLEIWPVFMLHHSSDPGIAIEECDPAGCQPPPILHLVWAEHIPDETAPGEIYYSRSEDGGFQWSGPENLSRSPTPSEHPSIAVDGRRIVHVVWEERLTTEPQTDILYINHSVHGWTAPVNISQTPLASTYPTVESNYTYHWSSMPPVAPDDRVHIAWTEFAPREPGDLVPWIAYRSFDPLYGWLPLLGQPAEDATRGRGGALASLIAFPSLFEVGRAPAVVWQWPYDEGSTPATPSDIYFNDRISGAWGTPRLVTTGPAPHPASRRHASLAPRAGAFGDTLWALWEEWDAESHRSEIYSAFSPDLGANWLFYLNMSRTRWDLSLHPSLAYQKGTSFAGPYDFCWTEVPMFGVDQGPFYVFCIGATALRDSIYSSVAAPAGRAFSPVLATCYPNPAAARVTFAVSVTEATPIAVSLYDIRGRRVARQAGTASGPGQQLLVWDGRSESGREAPPGVYYYQVEAAGAKIKGRLVLIR